LPAVLDRDQYAVGVRTPRRRRAALHQRADFGRNEQDGDGRQDLAGAAQQTGSRMARRPLSAKDAKATPATAAAVSVGRQVASRAARAASAPSNPEPRASRRAE
jgi:hypothetical protein